MKITNDVNPSSGVRGEHLRGEQMTRIETFVDAAFAFSVTLLVVSIDAIPESVPDLLEAFKGVPAFAGSFALIALFWYKHHSWSEAYGLNDGPTILLSLLLVFQILVYVYPLKMLFASCFHWMSGGYLPGGLAMDSSSELATLFVVYGVGFAALGGTIWLLFAHAWRMRTDLGLSLTEAVDTRVEMLAAAMMALSGLASAGLALLIPANPRPWNFVLPGLIYNILLLIPFLAPRYARRERRRLGAIGGATTPSGPSAAG